MDELDFFSKKVRLPYGLDLILSNSFNYKERSFYNQASNEYKKRINICYDRIEDDLKMDLVDFIDDFLPILKAELIAKERNINIPNPNTDYAKDYLLAFTTTKYDYLSEWVREKRIQTEKLYHNLINENTIETKIKSIDLSDTIGTEKIIMLHKLGVLDFLKEKYPFNTSTNALASAISGITGIKQKSVYPMINPIFNSSNVQKNNPLNIQKTVNKVTQKLIEIGYNPID